MKMIWGTRNEQISKLPIDLDAWQKCYNRNQQEYIRRRLRAIKLYCEGKSRTMISKALGISYKTLIGPPMRQLFRFIHSRWS
jgi:hypothetical protein